MQLLNGTPVGEYGDFKLTEKGLYKLTDEGKKRVSEPLYIAKTQQNIVSNDVELELVYKYRDRWCMITVSRQDLNDKKIQALARKGVDVHSGNAKDIEAYLVAQESKSQYLSSYDYVGWHDEGGELQFGLDVPMSSEGEILENIVYDGKFDLKATGNRDVYFQLIQEEVVGHPPLEFILALAVAGVINSYDNLSQSSDLIFTHLYGESSTGKTSAAKLAASVFGKPSVTNDGLIRTWNATVNALIAQFGDIHGVPLILDEASSCGNNYDFSATIYRFSQGTDKARSNADMTLRRSYTWSGVMISTAEHELVERTNKNSGLKVRTLELESVPWTRDREHAEKLNNTLEKNYGFLGKPFVKFFLEKKLDTYKEDLQVNTDWLLNNQVEWSNNESTSLSQRVLKKFAYVLLAAEYLNECFNFDLDVENILRFILENDEKQAPRRNRAEAALQLINSKMVENENFILTSDGFSDVRGKIIGKKTRKDTAILKEVVDKWLSEAGYNDPKQVMTELKNKSYISAEVNRNTRKRKIADREVVTYVFPNS